MTQLFNVPVVPVFLRLYDVIAFDVTVFSFYIFILETGQGKKKPENPNRNIDDDDCGLSFCLQQVEFLNLRYTECVSVIHGVANLV